MHHKKCAANATSPECLVWLTLMPVMLLFLPHQASTAFAFNFLCEMVDPLRLVVLVANAYKVEISSKSAVQFLPQSARDSQPV
jgi:hypothetical protein